MQKEDHHLDKAHLKKEPDNVNTTTPLSSNINTLRCWSGLVRRGSNQKFKSKQPNCIGLDKVAQNSLNFITRGLFMSVYHWNNNSIVIDFLKDAIDQTLRLKYEYVDKYQEQIKKQQQALKWIELDHVIINFNVLIRRSNFIGDRHSDEETFDSSIMMKSVFELPQMSPQMTLQRQMMVGSLCRLNEEEGRKMLESCLYPKYQSSLKIESSGFKQ